jgi:hypothetical protein
MADPGRLAVAIEHADGTTSRWGSDEPAAGDVPAGLTFSTRVPGGFGTMGCSLARLTSDEARDLERLDDVTVYGPGGEHAWEGRQSAFPREAAAINVDAVGYATHLLDDPSFRCVFVDRDLASWGEPPAPRIVAIAAAFNPYGEQMQVTVKGTLIHFTAPTQKNIEAGSTVEVWRRMPVGTLAAVAQAAVDQHGTGDIESARFRVTDDEDGTTFTDYVITVDGTVKTAVFTIPTRYVTLRFKADLGLNKAAGAGVYRDWQKLAIFGDHGLTRYPTDTDEPDGVLARDVIRYVLAQAAPLIRVDDSKLAPGDGFVIPHLVFDTPTTAEDVILRANAFHMYAWGVEDNRTFFWRPADEYRRRWVARIGDGAVVSDEGEQSETAVNGVLVSFTDPAGEQRLAGPPGSGADTEDVLLEITDPQNVVNAHGIPRKWGRLELAFTTTALGAIQAGARWLAEQERIEHRGSIVVYGTIEDADSAVIDPVWAVRAGDGVRVEDADGNVLDDFRQIVETTYTHDDRSNSLSIEALPHTSEAIQERMGVVLVGRLTTT